MSLIARSRSRGSLLIPHSEPAILLIVSSIKVPPRSLAPDRKIVFDVSIPSFTHDT